MTLERRLAEYLRSAHGLRKALGISADAMLSLTSIGHGEYNANYRFADPATGRDLLLRVNFGSQMRLRDQIDYEYRALRLLESSGRTPRALYVDGSCSRLPHGVLVMDYLPGRPVEYEVDLRTVAEILADVHSVDVPAACHLIRPEHPARAIVDECRRLIAVYTSSRHASPGTTALLQRLLLRGAEFATQGTDGGPDAFGVPVRRHVVNTELNAANFLINRSARRSYLVDWEKPVIGEVEQDLGHFLAPTTTLWKTDSVLSPSSVRAFLTHYRAAVAGRFETEGMEVRVSRYRSLACLRGVSWCAMAFVEYQASGRALRSEDTYERIKEYLSNAFLERIDDEFFG